ncbi:hypothetical protein F5880DRAFT_1508181 [Lentinula raphanica]|nr:hypothetical protein F5880DRAFT_1508181 [Lentinula raphanica]
MCFRFVTATSTLACLSSFPSLLLAVPLQLAGRADLELNIVQDGPHSLSTSILQARGAQATFLVTFASHYSNFDLQKRPASPDAPAKAQAIFKDYLRTQALSPTHAVDFKNEYHGPGIEGTEIKFDLLDSESGQKCSGGECKGLLQLLGGHYFGKLFTDTESKSRRKGFEYPEPDSLVDLGNLEPPEPGSRLSLSPSISLSKTLFVEYAFLDTPVMGEGAIRPFPPKRERAWYTYRDAEHRKVVEELIAGYLKEKLFKGCTTVHFLDRLITTAFKTRDITLLYLRAIDSSHGYSAYRVTILFDHALSKEYGSHILIGAFRKIGDAEGQRTPQASTDLPRVL